MVRLKVACLDISYRVIGFQFQYGAIESLKGSLLRQSLSYFNSSMVRLKEYSYIRSYIPILFQFQYGAIERQYGLTANIASLIFQFQYGAIESRPFFRIHFYNIYISIPVWCD